ncbi:MAG: hypothetical protein WB565_13415 [Acidimicrobiales bacterium]
MDAASPPRTGSAVHGRSEAPPTPLPPDPFGAARKAPAQAVPAIELPEPPLSPPTPAREHFVPAIVSKLRCYVYLLVDPRTGRPFFVGKGRGDRCFDHVAAARSAPDEEGEGGGEDPYPVLDRIREAESDGREVRIDILRHGLGTREAQLVEAAVADALGLEVKSKLSSQRRAAGEMDVALAKRAKFKRSHQMVLLRVGGPGADASYDIARHSWRIGRRWIDPGAPRSPRWAVLVVGELVAAVFRIDHWEPTGSSGTARSDLRYSFVGVRDEELESRYLGRSVATYRAAGRESPVTYVWCGPHWVNTAG